MIWRRIQHNSLESAIQIDQEGKCNEQYGQQDICAKTITHHILAKY